VIIAAIDAETQKKTGGSATGLRRARDSESTEWALPLAETERPLFSNLLRRQGWAIFVEILPPEQRDVAEERPDATSREGDEEPCQSR
jgi:hypothetical protein